MKKRTIVFIVGSGHSGSTIVDRLLGHHPSAFSIGEIVNFHLEINKNNLCGCASLIRDCGFWTKIIKNIKEKYNIDILSNPSNFNLRFENSSYFLNNKILRVLFYFILIFGSSVKLLLKKEWLENTKILYEQIFNETNTNFIIDSSKNIFRAIVISKVLKNQYYFKILYNHRDGRGFLASEKKDSYKVSLLDESGNLITKTYPRNNVKKTSEKIIKGWIKDNKKILIAKRLYKLTDFEKVKFEKLLSNPQTELNRIFNFLGIKYDEKVLNFSYGDNHMVCGNASRINAMKLMPDQASWNQSLNKDELLLFDKIAGKFNNKLIELYS